MAVLGYDGKPIAGAQGVFISLRERLDKKDPSITKETFIQLKNDLEAFRGKHASAGFMDKFPIEGPSGRLGFPPITTSEALALISKVRMAIGA